MKELTKINWDFSDYNSTKYPLDLNSIPWYPATFISPIPRLLIALLSEPNDRVLDPFGGKGTVAIEALLQNRIPIYNDLNPFAKELLCGLIAAIEYQINGMDTLENEMENIRRNILTFSQIDDYLAENGISKDVRDWFHPKTLAELLSIHRLIVGCDDVCSTTYLIRKLAFSAILKSASSQPGHFTYITDNCKPRALKEKDAITLYAEKIEQIMLAAKEFLIQYSFTYSMPQLRSSLSEIQIKIGNAKNLDWITTESVDLVITSPPYLCAQDYIKTMRLMNLFFKNEQAFSNDYKEEIGPRRMRKGNSSSVVSTFYDDMNSVFNNIHRVLRNDALFCLIVGQGKAKITEKYNVIDDLSRMAQNECHFELLFQHTRKIGNRVIQVGGVDTEDILIFKKIAT